MRLSLIVFEAVEIRNQIQIIDKILLEAKLRKFSLHNKLCRTLQQGLRKHCLNLCKSTNQCPQAVHVVVVLLASECWPATNRKELEPPGATKFFFVEGFASNF